MMRNLKIIGLTGALLTAILILIASIGVQADSQNRTSLGGAVVGGVVVPPEQGSIYYPREQISKTITFRSMIPNVEATGFAITGDQQIEVSLRYTGRDKTPAVTVIVSTEWMPIPLPYLQEPMPLQSQEVRPDVKGEYYPQLYPSLIGSTILTGDWSLAAKVQLGLAGKGTVYDFTSIQIVIIPYTGKV